MMERKFWNEEKETLPLKRLRKLQDEGLQNAVDWTYRKSKFYRNLFDQAGVIL
jgi:phenylacetate-coenzyme A ligase PaaK-like adenylate-forming protein